MYFKQTSFTYQKLYIWGTFYLLWDKINHWCKPFLQPCLPIFTKNKYRQFSLGGYLIKTKRLCAFISRQWLTERRYSRVEMSPKSAFEIKNVNEFTKVFCVYEYLYFYAMCTVQDSKHNWITTKSSSHLVQYKKCWLKLKSQGKDFWMGNVTRTSYRVI